MKRAVIITDISGLGNCSGSTDIAVLSAMGIECCMIPTAVLSAQTGFADSYVKPLGDSFESMLCSLQRLSPNINAVLVGFLTNKKQTECVLSYINGFVGTDTLIITDPISGDNGRKFDFVSGDMLSDIRLIAENSAVITPNITEFCLLTNTDHSLISSVNDTEKYNLLWEKCGGLFDKGVKNVIITGIELSDGNLSNLSACSNGYTPCEITRYGGSYSGTGDLFTAILCGYIMKELSPDEAMRKAAGFVQKVLCENAADIIDRNYGIPYQKYLGELTE